EVHLDISIFETFGIGITFDRYLGVLPPKLLERHPVPELIADPLHLLEARLEPSGCFVGGHHLRTLGFQVSLKEHCRLDQREDIALQASSVVPSLIQTGAQEMTSCSSSLRWLLSDSNSVCIFSTLPSSSFPRCSALAKWSHCKQRAVKFERRIRDVPYPNSRLTGPVHKLLGGAFLHFLRQGGVKAPRKYSPDNGPSLRHNGGEVLIRPRSVFNLTKFPHGVPPLGDPLEFHHPFALVDKGPCGVP
ncbi:hypothetical protein GW17_00053513, partial [Ensete ventricosum]